jgi:hypothetical protein
VVATESGLYCAQANLWLLVRNNYKSSLLVREYIDVNALGDALANALLQ